MTVVSAVYARGYRKAGALSIDKWAIESMPSMHIINYPRNGIYWVALIILNRMGLDSGTN